MFKKIKVILAIFIILVCFTSVTYATNVDDLGNNTEALQATDLNINNYYSNNDLGIGSFTDLQNSIDKTNNGGVIVLDKNYAYSANDSNLINGIVIKNKNITIEGNGHSIDGLNSARIFGITSSNVVLNNLTFVNGMSSSDGGAILSSEGFISINNCNFTNNTAASGGAISSNSDMNISNSEFRNNTITSYAFGGAVDIRYSKVNIFNSLFISNVGYRGGAIYNIHSSLNCTRTKFWHNKASCFAGAVYTSNGQSNFLNCSFLRNYGRFGGAVSGEKSNIVNSSFTGNSAYFGGAVSCENINISGSTFVGNVANIGGAIYMVNGSVADSVFGANSADTGKDICSLVNVSIVNSEIASENIALYNASYTSITQDFFFIAPNGYKGYCIVPFVPPAISGYWVNDLSFVQNYVLKTYVGDYLKILIYTNFEDLKSIVNAIEIFTMGDYLNSDNPQVKAVLEKYNSGFRVPDKNATLILKNGTVASIDFAITASVYTQNLLLFNVTYDGYLNLSVLKIALNKTVAVGNQTSFTIVVSNTGNRPLFGISVLENIPEGLIYSGFAGNNWIKNGNTFIYNGTLNAGESCNFTITCNTTKSGNFTNVVVVDSPSTNKTTVNNTTEVVSPNLSVIKLVNTPNVYLGNQTSFTIIVKNTGDCSLDGVWVAENIPDGLVYAGFAGDNWVKVGDKFVYNSTLAAGQSVNFTIVFNTTRSGNFTNVVVAGADNTSNKTANNTTAVYAPNLEVIKLVNTPNVYLGNQTSFTVVVKNTGDCRLDNVWVVENIPEGLVYAGFTGDKWVKNGNKFIFTGSLAAGKSANFTIFFNTTKSGNFTNVVVAGADHVSNKTGNNTTEIIKHNNPVPGNDTDNSTDVPDNSTLTNVTSSVEGQNNVSKSVSIGNATGNPILVLLMVLALLGLMPLKGKK